MAKNKTPQRAMPRREPGTPMSAPAAPQQVSLGYDPKGPKVPVDIVSSKDAWSEYMLADGTIVRAKAVVLDARKMIDQFNQDGEPVYELQLTLVNQTRVPEELKKKD